MTFACYVFSDHPTDNVQFAGQDHPAVDESDQRSSHTPGEGEDERICPAGREI